MVLCGGALLSCSYRMTQSPTSKNITLDPSQKTDSSWVSFIKPYSDSLAAQMNEVIGESAYDFQVALPNCNLFNWCADAVFAQETRTVRLSEPVICILNAGGIRAGLNHGPITVGDIFKVMPFDNTVTWVRLPISRISDIETFMKKSSGLSLSNASYNKGIFTINSLNSGHTHFWVITSNYLAMGGDKMAFFLNPTETHETKRMLRDLFISEVKFQGTLQENLEIRFTP